jgi:hypothetical protein
MVIRNMARPLKVIRQFLGFISSIVVQNLFLKKIKKLKLK